MSLPGYDDWKTTAPEQPEPDAIMLSDYYELANKWKAAMNLAEEIESEAQLLFDEAGIDFDVLDDWNQWTEEQFHPERWEVEITKREQ